MMRRRPFKGKQGIQVRKLQGCQLTGEGGGAKAIFFNFAHGAKNNDSLGPLDV